MSRDRKLGAAAKVRWITGFIIILLLSWLLLPSFARSRAIVIMRAYDIRQTEKARLEEYPLTVELPYQKSLELESGSYEFLPVMNTFNASGGFSSWHGRELELVIDYAAPDFERSQWGLRKSHSAFYDPRHPLYTSYFGCYYLRGHDAPLDTETAMAVLEYDIRLLALPAVGLPAEDSSFQVSDIRQVDSLRLGSLEWTVYEAMLRMNGPQHEPDGFQPGYLQFGMPPPGDGMAEQYPVVTMHGRIYVTTLEEHDLSLGLYVLASTEEALAAIAETYLEEADLVLHQ